MSNDKSKTLPSLFKRRHQQKLSLLMRMGMTLSKSENVSNFNPFSGNVEPEGSFEFNYQYLSCKSASGTMQLRNSSKQIESVVMLRVRENVTQEIISDITSSG